MLVVADASPLRYLVALEKADLLPALFGRVWVPNRVINEVTSPRTPAKVRHYFALPPEWVVVRAPSPSATKSVQAAMDAGERESLALALEIKAGLVLADDGQARRAAQALHLDVTGTLGVLQRAAARGLVDVPSVIASIRGSGFYASETLLRSTFADWL